MLRALIELLRLELLPTAWADVLAGASLAGVLAAGPLAPVILATSCLYLFGMATNAIADVAADATLYPHRPLPSGRLRRSHAVFAAAVLLAGAAAGMAWMAPPGRLVAALIIALILAYNGGGKKIAGLGPLLMGSCRAANVFLGALGTGPGTDGAGHAAAAACALGAFVAGVTFASFLEGSPVPARRLRLLVGALLIVPAGLIPFARGLALVPVAGLAILIAAAVPAAGFRAGRADERLVHRLLGGIYLIDAAFLGIAGSVVLCTAATALGLAPEVWGFVRWLRAHRR
jgi:hypothetical protein